MPGETVTAVKAAMTASGTWREFNICGIEMTRMPPYMPNGAFVMPMIHSGNLRAWG
jgi:hypothetical protein